MKEILIDLLSELEGDHIEDWGDRGLPIVASFYSKENHKERIIYRNERGGWDNPKSHCETFLEGNDNFDSLIVSIIPCEACLEKILEENKNIKYIYYIVEYKFQVKKERYDQNNLKWRNLFLYHFKPKNKEEYELSKKIYYHFIAYTIQTYFFEGVKEKIIDKKKESLLINSPTSSITYLSIIESITEGIIRRDINNKNYLINLKKLESWWDKIEKLSKNNDDLMKYLLKYDFGINMFIKETH